jgi:hypothetical protein
MRTHADVCYADAGGAIELLHSRTAVHAAGSAGHVAGDVGDAGVTTTWQMPQLSTKQAVRTSSLRPHTLVAQGLKH